MVGVHKAAASRMGHNSRCELFPFVGAVDAVDIKHKGEQMYD